MAQKSDFKTVETDLDELEEKIRKHRRKIAKRIIIVMWQRPFTVFTYSCVVVKKTFRIIHRCLLKLVLFIIS